MAAANSSAILIGRREADDGNNNNNKKAKNLRVAWGRNSKLWCTMPIDECFFFINILHEF